MGKKSKAATPFLQAITSISFEDTDSPRGVYGKLMALDRCEMATLPEEYVNFVSRTEPIQLAAISTDFFLSYLAPERKTDLLQKVSALCTTESFVMALLSDHLASCKEGATTGALSFFMMANALALGASPLLTRALAKTIDVMVLTGEIPFRSGGSLRFFEDVCVVFAFHRQTSVMSQAVRRLLFTPSAHVERETALLTQLAGLIARDIPLDVRGSRPTFANLICVLEGKRANGLDVECAQPFVDSLTAKLQPFWTRRLFIAYAIDRHRQDVFECNADVSNLLYVLITNYVAFLKFLVFLGGHKRTYPKYFVETLCRVYPDYVHAINAGARYREKRSVVVVCVKTAVVVCMTLLAYLIIR